MGKPKIKVRDEVFQLDENDVVMRLECWDLLVEAAGRENFTSVPEWILHTTLKAAMWRAMCEQEDELADRLAVAMNERWPLRSAVA